MTRRRSLKPGALLALVLAAPSFADEPAAPSAAASTASQATSLAPESPWRLGLALGYGRRSNPLIQSKDIPVAVDVDIAYFGHRWFFDNGDLGVELWDRPAFTTNLVARVNSDRAFFSKTNTKYVTLAYSIGGSQIPVEDPKTGYPLVEPVRIRPPRRSYAVEMGLEMLLDGDWGQSTLRAFHDVSNTHDGYELSADYSYRFTKGRFSISPTAGIAFKSASLNDYYWGVHPGEASLVLPEYHPSSGIGWQAGLRTNYYLTRNLRVAVSVNYERLQDSVAKSPLVDEGYVYGYFAGFGYQF